MDLVENRNRDLWSKWRKFFIGFSKNWALFILKCFFDGDKCLLENVSYSIFHIRSEHKAQAVDWRLLIEQYVRRNFKLPIFQWWFSTSHQDTYKVTDTFHQFQTDAFRISAKKKRSIHERHKRNDIWTITHFMLLFHNGTDDISWNEIASAKRCVIKWRCRCISQLWITWIKAKVWLRSVSHH